MADNKKTCFICDKPFDAKAGEEIMPPVEALLAGEDMVRICPSCEISSVAMLEELGLGPIGNLPQG